ncbi:hypothetical protein H0H93_011663 [Arthromyces matolae]|nr:hypothetical protein H0H93_011663 [Arthromyces matolae]
MHISSLLNDSFDDSLLSDSPINSSPPNSPRGTPSELDLSSDDVLATSNLTTHTRKRQLDEDLTQYAESLSRKLHFKPLVEKEFKKFAQLSLERQIVWLAGHVLSVSENIHSVASADSTQYQIPAVLGNRLERYVFAAIVSSTVSSYVKNNELVNQVVEFLAQHPHWGLSPEVKSDKAKMDVIYSRIRARLTIRRYEIKTLLKDSIGVVDDEGNISGAQNILELGEAIINLGNRICDIKLSIQFLARVAVLIHQQRSIYVERAEQDPQTKDFWKTVDQQLDEIRGVKKTPEAISQLFTKVLECDRNKFGRANLNQVTATVETNVFEADE